MSSGSQRYSPSAWLACTAAHRTDEAYFLLKRHHAVIQPTHVPVNPLLILNVTKLMELIRTNLVRQALDSNLIVSLLKGTVPRLDKALLRGSRGWLNTGLQTVVLLRTTGAKSGIEREIATLCMPVGRDLALVGSNWGQERDPAWVHNLRANPAAHITYRGFSGTMIGRELKGRERSDMWQHLVHYNPQYGVYQENTQRCLPVMLMHRPD